MKTMGFINSHKENENRTTEYIEKVGASAPS